MEGWSSVKKRSPSQSLAVRWESPWVEFRSSRVRNFASVIDKSYPVRILVNPDGLSWMGVTGNEMLSGKWMSLTCVEWDCGDANVFTCRLYVTCHFSSYIKHFWILSEIFLEFFVKFLLICVLQRIWQTTRQSAQVALHLVWLYRLLYCLGSLCHSKSLSLVTVLVPGSSSLPPRWSDAASPWPTDKHTYMRLFQALQVA